MSRYIDTDQTDEVIKTELGMYDTTELKEMLKYFPTADVAPVIHAHWEREEGYEGTRHICSNCRSRCPSVLTEPATVDRPYGEVEEIELSDIIYCPHCSAKMDEEVKQ